MAIKTKRFIVSRKSCSCSMPGIWRAVAYCKGVVVIFHSPKACAHVARTMDINAHFRTMSEGKREEIGSVPLLSSQLEEKHSIFGGVERLEACIAHAVKEYAPECLVIANSCVAGVIGDDVEAVARKAQEQYKLPVLSLDCCGFLDGEYYEGYYGITELLVERFVRPLPSQEGKVLLLGDNGGPWGHYAQEVTRILNAMGVQVLGQFPGYMAFQDLPKVAAAEAIIVLGGRGQTHVGLTKIAGLMQKKLGIPYLNQYPVDWQQTQEWIMAVGELLHRQDEAKRVLVQERELFASRLAAFLPITKQKKVVLCIGRLLQYFHPGAVLATIRLLQLDLLGVVLLDAYEPKEKEKMLLELNKHEGIKLLDAEEGEELLQDADIVLTTHELQNKELKQIFLPMLPKVGTMGELEFMEMIYRRLCSRIQGGMTYV
ncbi:MAG: nitrogenase component 1 [Phascolarctobacterium sp.]